jgi:hypothetical protein
LYVWNVAISAALWGGFNVMEVALRNTMHTQLALWVGMEDWWNGKVPLFPFGGQSPTPPLPWPSRHHQCHRDMRKWTENTSVKLDPGASFTKE